MGIWSNLVGRKSAPVDGGMSLPPWLRTNEASAGFAFVPGMLMPGIFFMEPMS